MSSERKRAAIRKAEQAVEDAKLETGGERFNNALLKAELFAAKERIAELERELTEQARLNGMGSEREAALMAKLAAAQATISRKDEALRAINEVAPRYIECYAVHHSKKDRHEHDQPCPVINKYESALLKIDEALALPADRTALDAMLAEARKKAVPTFDALCAALIGARVVEHEAIEDAEDYDDCQMLERVRACHRRLRQAAERSE